jgi:hypothetical protein
MAKIQSQKRIVSEISSKNIIRGKRIRKQVNLAIIDSTKPSSCKIKVGGEISTKNIVRGTRIRKAAISKYAPY